MGRVPTISLVRPTPCRDAVLPRVEAPSGASRRPERWSRLRRRITSLLYDPSATAAQIALRALPPRLGRARAARCSLGRSAAEGERRPGRAGLAGVPARHALQREHRVHALRGMPCSEYSTVCMPISSVCSSPCMSIRKIAACEPDRMAASDSDCWFMYGARAMPGCITMSCKYASTRSTSACTARVRRAARARARHRDAYRRRQGRRAIA